MSGHRYLTLTHEIMVPATIHDERGFVPSPDKGVVQTEQGAPSQHDATKTALRNGSTTNGNHHDNGFVNDRTVTTFESKSTQSEGDKSKVVLARQSELNGLSINSEGRPIENFTQNNPSKSDSNNKHELSMSDADFNHTTVNGGSDLPPTSTSSDNSTTNGHGTSEPDSTLSITTADGNAGLDSTSELSEVGLTNGHENTSSNAKLNLTVGDEHASLTPTSDTGLANGFGTQVVDSKLELHTPEGIANLAPTPPISENGLNSEHGTSTLVSKLTALDNLAPTTNTSASFEYLDPFVPASTRLRHIIAHSPDILVCPGVYDGLSARIAHSVGFQGLYMTGAGTTASVLGAADLGIAQLHDMRTNAQMIANLRPGGSGPPVIADMDTGYGGPLVIARSLAAYVQAGVAGFHIEDQIAEKRCGHLKGKEVVDVETYIQRIKACVLARARMHSDIVIIARTDANQPLGYDECIMRLRRARDEGADMGIMEGFVTKEEARQAVIDLAPWPLCLNSVENGVSPLISASEAQEMGFKVVIFSFAALAPAYVAIKRTFEQLMTQGVTGTPKEITPATIFRVCGLDEEAEFDRAIKGPGYSKGY
jgi:methylisocitrate lyase